GWAGKSWTGIPGQPAQPGVQGGRRACSPRAWKRAAGQVRRRDRRGHAGGRVLLCKPMEFMNVSGQAVARVAGFWKVPVAELIVVHDELDLPFGRLKLGAGGGHGGHNGIRSLLADLGDASFARVRVGVGRPTPGHDPANYLLSNFSRAEAKELPELIGAAADAVQAILTGGLTAAMNKFNGKGQNNKDTRD